MALRIAFVGKKAAGKTYAAHYLFKYQGFKHLRMQDGVYKIIKWFYKYRPHERILWEKRIAFYDALYAVDNDIHVDWILRRLAITTTDVVIDDVRYSNEVTKLKAAGFIIVRISMPENKRRRLAGMSTASYGTVKLTEYFSAASERYPVDYSIINENHEALCTILDSIVKKEREKQQ